MSTTNTPRPSADEIRELVAEAEREAEWIGAEAPQAGSMSVATADRLDSLICRLVEAVESLLEDAELLDDLEAMLRDAGGSGVVSAWLEDAPFGERRVAVASVRGKEGHRGLAVAADLRAALKQAVGG